MTVISNQVLVNYPSDQVRLFFRIYFIAFGITAGLLGNACITARSKMSLLKGKDLRVTRMLGWLWGFDSILTVFKIRTMPGGSMMGLLMIVVYLVSLAADLIGTFVRSVEVHDRCLFGTGMVIPLNVYTRPFNDSNKTPSVYGSPYAVAAQAQVNSLANHGLQGIYGKVNRDSTFSADVSDVIGAWRCVQNPLQLNYSKSEALQDIIDDLAKNNLIYRNDGVFYEESMDIANGLAVYDHYVIVDPMHNDDIASFLDVRVSASNFDVESWTITMSSFQCNLNDHVGWIKNVMSGINVTSTLSQWGPLIQGSCYDGRGTPLVSDVGPVLERIFNSMVMVIGGDDYLLESSQANATQGCITGRTQILWEVFALAATLAALNVFLVVLKVWTSLKTLNRNKTLAVDLQKKKSMENTIPDDILGWMIQAVRESKALSGTASSQDTKRKLKAWTFGWIGYQTRFGILTNDTQLGDRK